MDPDELNITTMDINHRVLKKITVDDCVLADQIFNELMGEEVDPRKKFIEENANDSELDIEGGDYGRRRKRYKFN